MEINRYGVKFNVDKDSYNGYFWKQRFLHKWEEKTFEFLLKHWHKEKTFIDIGAWIAPISIIAASYSDRVLAFEPDPVAFREMVDNINRNEIKNIIPFEAAISTRNDLKLGAARLGRSITREGYRKNSFYPECHSISDILHSYNLNENNISAIKIDIEGHEQELLQDETLINLNVPMFISIHPRLFKDKSFNGIKKFIRKKRITMPWNAEGKLSFDIEIEKRKTLIQQIF